jgi:hypothetical protein
MKDEGGKETHKTKSMDDVERTVLNCYNLCPIQLL